MSCKRIEDRLLDDEQALLDRDVRKHLESCSTCRRFLRELEEMEGLFRDLAKSERAPHDFTGQVIEQVSSGSRFKLFLLTGGCVLAVALILTAVGRAPDSESAGPMVSQQAPVGSPTTYPLLDQSQPVEFDLHYPRVRLYVIDPPSNLTPEMNSAIEILPVDQAQTDYLQYVSH